MGVVVEYGFLLCSLFLLTILWAYVVRFVGLFGSAFGMSVGCCSFEWGYVVF